MHRVLLTNVGNEFCSDSALSHSRNNFTVVQQSDSVHYSCVVYYKGGIRYLFYRICATYLLFQLIGYLVMIH